MSGYPDGGLSDRDLADALRPLAGDPASDWARVMDALPEVQPAPRPVWPWVAAAAAAGLLIGFVASRATAPSVDTPPERQPIAAIPLEDLPRVAGGEGQLVEETDSGIRELVTGDRIPFERFVATVGKAHGIVVLPDAVELRLNGGTRVALLGPRSFELAGGQLFVRVPEEAPPVLVATLDGEVTASAGSVQVTAYEGRTEVVALEGTAEFADPTGETVILKGGSQIAFANGLLGKVEPAGLAWDHVWWQIEMLAGCVDRRKEALSWTWTLIEALRRPASSEQAERALRHAGPLGAGTLGMALYDLPDSEVAVRKRCWLLLADVAGAQQLSYVLGGMTEEDPDIRVAVVRAVERITAIPSGRDEAFWREAPQSTRFGVVTAWRERLRGF